MQRVGAQALVDWASASQFKPEINDAFELGAKYNARPASTFNVALFRQLFRNFQLNTFNGTFIVQNINGCKDDLGGADEDQSKFTAAPNFNAAAATSGACDEDDVKPACVSHGVEIEASTRPMRDLRLNAGLVYANTKYRDDLVGSDAARR